MKFEHFVAGFVAVIAGILGFVIWSDQQLTRAQRFEQRNVIRDPATGCEYIVMRGFSPQATPRLDADGKHICGERKSRPAPIKRVLH